VITYINMCTVKLRSNYTSQISPLEVSGVVDRCLMSAGCAAKSQSNAQSSWSPP
jgi:hypothetical protein